MSGSYPNNFNNNPMSGPRGHFSPQHQMAAGNGMYTGGVPMQHAMNPMHAAGRGMMNPNQLQQQQQQQPQQSLGMLPARQMPQFQSHVSAERPPNVRHAAPTQQTQQQQQTTIPSYQHTTGGGQAPAGSMLPISHQTSSKEINIVALSRLGQETVQDITSRFQEIFGALKIIQPTSNRDNSTEKKVQEYFRTIRLLFKRLRIIYEKCNDGYPQGMEYTQVENLISYKDEPERRNDVLQCEDYKKALQENQELIETVKLKNRQLREIIDRHRIIIWEINTMLNMRRS